MLRHLRIVYERTRFEIYKFLGVGKYAHPAQFGMDLALEKYMPYDHGFFVEVGANDGYAQSNTYYFEKSKHWSGILIEGIPQLYERCMKERKRSTVINCALVAKDCPDKVVKMHYANLMSLVSGSRKSTNEDIEWVATGCDLQGIDSYNILVPARTLTDILLEHNVKAIDLLSVDVEGLELSVLQGLDLALFRPKFILVEANFRDEITAHLNDSYEMVEEFPRANLLFRLRNKTRAPL